MPSEPGRVFRGSVPPPAPNQGDVWVDTTQNQVNIHDGTNFKQVPLDQAVTSRMVALTQSQVSVATTETTTSTTFTDLATTGPAITLTPGVTQNHLLHLACALRNSGTPQSSIMSVSIAGAAAADADGVENTLNSNIRTGTSRLAASAASGATHTAKYRVSAGTGTFQDRRLIGICI